MAGTHTEPFPVVMSPPFPGTPTAIVAVTRFVAGSTRETLPSPWFNTQMLPKPAARKRGEGPTLIVATIFSDLGSIRDTRLLLVLVTQIEPSPSTAVYEPAGMRIRDTTWLVCGLMRASMPVASEGIQMLPSPAVIPPSVSATPVAIDATRFCDKGSSRHTLPSPQLGIHTLRKPIANPAQGALPTEMVAMILLVCVSIFETLFFGLFEIQTLSPIPTQSEIPVPQSWQQGASPTLAAARI